MPGNIARAGAARFESRLYEEEVEKLKRRGGEKGAHAGKNKKTSTTTLYSAAKIIWKLNRESAVISS